MFTRLSPLIALSLGACSLFGPPDPGLLQVTVTPEDAVLTIGGEVCTAGEPFSHAPGEVSFTVERRGYTGGAQQVVIESGETRDVHVALLPLSFDLSFASDPPGATVREGEAVLGQTPFVYTALAGPHEYTLDLHRMRQETVSLYVEQAEDVGRVLQLTDQILERVVVFPTCGLPKGVLIHPERDEVWVSCLNGQPSVVVHDLHTGERLAELQLDAHGAVELHFDADAERIFASQMETARVYEIDVAERVLLRTFDTRSNWSKVIELSVDGSHIYVANWNFDDVSDIDLETGQTVRRMDTIDTPRGLYATPDGRWLYVAGFGGGQLARIELETGQSEVLWSEGRNLRHMVASPDGQRLFLSDMGRRAIFSHDLATGETTHFANAGANTNTIDITPDGAVLLVSNRGLNGPGGYLTAGPRGSVLAIDAETGEILDAIAAGSQPTALDVERDWLVFSDFRDDRLQVFRIPDIAVLRAGNGGRRHAYRAELTRSEDEL